MLKHLVSALKALPPVLFLLVAAAIILILRDVGSYLDANLQRDIVKLLLAVIVVYGLVWKSRWLDRRAGINFKDSWNEMLKGNRAVALYLGLRWIGICIIGLGILLLA